MDFGKTANPFSADYIRRNIRMICLKFVWRQLGFAFFGALTSVGALFYFTENKDKQKEKRK